MHFRGTNEARRWPGEGEGGRDLLLPNDLLPWHYRTAPYSRAYLLLTTYFLFQEGWKNFQKMLSIYINKSMHFFPLLNATKGIKALITLKVSHSKESVTNSVTIC